MKIKKFEINKSCLLFLIIPVIFMFGGLGNILKINSPSKIYSGRDIIYEEMIFNEEDGAFSVGFEDAKMQLNNIDSQVKTIVMTIENLPSFNMKASLVFNNYTQDSEPIQFFLRNGKNIIELPTYQQINNVQINFNTHGSYQFLIKDISINSCQFSFLALLTVLISVIIVFSNKHLKDLNYKSAYLVFAVVINYLFYELILEHSLLRVQILAFLLLIFSQLFLKYIFLEVNQNDEKNEVK